MQGKSGDSWQAQAARIRALNDQLRRESVGGHECVSIGIVELGYEEFCEIREKVKAFETFTTANDPYAEHDFGSFTHNGHDIFWKIDYYDNTSVYASPDPTDPSVTTRIITIMLASEY